MYITGGHGVSEVQLAWASCTSEGATRPVELHLRGASGAVGGASGTSPRCDSHILGSEWSL